MSQEIVILNEIKVNAVFYKSQPVLTFGMIDTLHQRPEGTSRVTFNRNKKRFIQDEDYFVCDAYEAKALGFTAPNGLIFLAESGYLMLVKSFTDDLSWQIQRQLVKLYFRVKELAEQPAPQPTLSAEQWQVIRALMSSIEACFKWEGSIRFALDERIRFATALQSISALRPEHFEEVKADLEDLRALSMQHLVRMRVLEKEFITTIVRPPVSIRKVRALARKQAAQPPLTF